MSLDKIEFFTLDTFPITEANRGHYNVAKELALNPTNAFRLVFFHLPAHQALHLKYALCNYWKSSIEWASFSMYEFTDDLVAAILNYEYQHMIQKYTAPHVLILDDAHHIANKESTQEEFYRILKQRIEHRKVTILFSEYGVDTLRMLLRDDLHHLLMIGTHNDE